MDKTIAKPGFFARARQLVIGTVQAFLDPDTSLRCAGTAFFSFLSLFPAVGIAVFTAVDQAAAQAAIGVTGGSSATDAIVFAVALG